MAELFEKAYAELEADLKCLEALNVGDDALVPVCGGLALVRGKVCAEVTIRFGGDLFVRVRSKQQAIEILHRQMARFRLTWVIYLERFGTADDLEKFEVRVGISKRSNGESEQTEENMPSLLEMMSQQEPLFFEPYDST